MTYPEDYALKSIPTFMTDEQPNIAVFIKFGAPKTLTVNLDTDIDSAGATFKVSVYLAADNSLLAT